MSKKQKRYTREFKEGAIQLALSAPSVTNAAQELNVPSATLHSWVNKAKENEEQLIINANGVTESINVTTVLAENKELKKQLARLEQEKAILKKAATYFAKELGW